MPRMPARLLQQKDLLRLCYVAARAGWVVGPGNHKHTQSLAAEQVMTRHPWVMGATVLCQQTARCLGLKHSIACCSSMSDLSMSSIRGRLAASMAFSKA